MAEDKLFVEEGPVTAFTTGDRRAFDVAEEEVMFIPEGVEYQLINYASHAIKAIFSIAPWL